MGLFDNKVHPVDLLAQRDAFGRFRISTPQTLFDSKLLVADNALYWDDQQTSGTATSTYSATNTSVTIAVNNLTAGTRVRQTKRRMNYQPGKSQLIFITFTMGAGATGITKRLGYYDQSNGLFLESLNGVTSIGVRKNTVDTKVVQASWNIDTMDGNGPSGVTLDFTKSQILLIDFEWLGVGSVRYGFVVDGNIFYVHQQTHSNRIANVYSANPNLPIRYEIINSGTGPAASLECICSSVNAEAGYEAIGTVQTVDMGVASLTINNNANIYSLIAIRLKSNYLMATVTIENFNVLATGTSTYRYLLLLNPTVAGAALTWTPVTDSAIEYALPVIGNTLTGGVLLQSGYNIGTNNSKVPATTVTPNFLTLGSTIAGVSDTMFIAVQRVSAADTFLASITYRELV